MKSEKIFLLCLLTFIISSVSAQSVSEKRSFMKSLPVSKGSKLEVKNRHGDIRITTWNKDSVFVMAEIEAFAPTRSKLNNMLDGINIDISETASLIRATTEFDQSLNTLLESFKGLTDKIFDYESRVQITYFINAPDYVNIKIDNQFGNVSMENNRGIVSLSISNGDFKANSLNEVSDFNLNFGEAEIEYLKSGKITCTFAEFKITECGELSVNSTSSRFDIKKAGRIYAESRRDKFFAGTISELEGTSYFTDFRIESVARELDLTLKYGSLEVENTDNGFEKINIVSAYSDITLAFGPATSYDFEIRHINAFLVIPEKNTISDKEAINEDKKEYVTSGTHGSNPGSRRVEIEANRGNIHIR